MIGRFQAVEREGILQRKLMGMSIAGGLAKWVGVVTAGDDGDHGVDGVGLRHQRKSCGTVQALSPERELAAKELATAGRGFANWRRGGGLVLSEAMMGETVSHYLLTPIFKRTRVEEDGRLKMEWEVEKRSEVEDGVGG
ncbi:hypothetical protein L1887_16611 [Cichorium endivia]|nr:hypothetical protein L1887_16611 [Cichorium endivia]